MKKAMIAARPCGVFFCRSGFLEISVNGRIEFEFSDIDTANIQRLGHGLAKLSCLCFVVQ